MADGQYPYLVRLILWAKMLGLSASIDLHGLPGSQNGQDNSGLTGGVYFAANSSNTDRGLQVLGNLSREFSGDQYGGVVKSAYPRSATGRGSPLIVRYRTHE